MTIDILKMAGVIETLIYLLKYSAGKRKVDIRNDLKLAPNTAVKSFQILLDSNLIENKENNRDLFFVLTEKGKEIAGYLQNIADAFSKENSKKVILLQKGSQFYLKNDDGSLTPVEIHENSKTFKFDR